MWDGRQDIQPVPMSITPFILPGHKFYWGQAWVHEYSRYSEMAVRARRKRHLAYSPAPFEEMLVFVSNLERSWDSTHVLFVSQRCARPLQ
ncbi:hypothetical protein AVEN_188879-1 [Araneus ventricosus]|uniref:Uncharacterized protein n=1 Tax=Araneus ventricosus TaxID=182803 RepID=A0A4Y2PKP8_ARAVE|nr:hypothetical protein AVEN_188879-1 [Araneus ventricosus]